MADTKMSKVNEQRLALLGREMLKMAGLKRQHVRAAFKRTLGALDAEDYFVKGDGERVLIGPNHKMRLVGADQIYRMIGMYQSVQGEAGHRAGMVVEVALCSPDGTRTVVRVGPGIPDVVSEGGEDGA